MAASAVLRELVQRAHVGEAPAPADPDLADAVRAALQSAADHQAGLAADSDGATLLSAATAIDVVEDESAAPDADSPATLTFAIERATAHLSGLLSSIEPAAVAVEPAPLTPDAILAQQIAEGRADSERLRAYAGVTAGHANGRLPARVLAELSWARGHRLRPDAAAQLERLNTAFRARFGHDLHITDSYRSFDGQVRARALRGRLAATPGTSNHGWGVAVDLGSGVNRFGTATHRWMRENAPSFGWHLPGWARENGSKPEPWHWEFEGAPESFAD
ncbi:hypothetical protein ET495_05275 [Xylanimonas allomyrinae]|uniref:D-alanyl-D-alanine carboxypeptidase-like core domain-containing protein n=1 Tax=Xylanimonas allomyrinae TaxID=2509459 RepID=A0A4P6ES26_9MICO|nr:hypothetical protein ET495_05275 [Xylanimonas allomyrinae]